MQEKGTILALCLTQYPASIFFKYSAKKVFCFLGNIFNKVKRGIVQKPGAGRAYNGPGWWLLLAQAFGHN